MKKIILLILAAVMALSLFSCGEDDEHFDPIPSTEEEARVVMTFTVADKVYEVRYELYRALFVGNHTLVDGGDTSVWSGSDADDKIDEINEIIIDRAAEIYSVLYLADKLGIDPYSSEFDKAIQKKIKLYVYGGEGDNGTKVIGYGSYEKYLRALSDLGMNSSVGELMFRYSYAKDKINAKLIDSVSTSNEKLLEYYESEDCARIIEAYFQFGTKTEARVKEIRKKLADANSFGELASLIIQYTTAVSSEVIDANGNPVGKPLGLYELDDYYYYDYTHEAFSTYDGGVSDVIKVDKVNDSYVDGYYILVRIEKTSEYFENNKTAIRNSYINNAVGRTFYDAKETLLDDTRLTEAYGDIIHSNMIPQSDPRVEFFRYLKL